jgi:cytochrome bd-type quinol oxidase subunit 1
MEWSTSFDGLGPRLRPVVLALGGLALALLLASLPPLAEPWPGRVRWAGIVCLLAAPWAVAAVALGWAVARRTREDQSTRW